MNKIIFLATCFLAACSSKSTDTNNRPPNNFAVRVMNVTTDTATIAWTEATDPDGDYVTYSISGDNIDVRNIQATHYTLINLKPNTTYNITITARDGKGGATDLKHHFTTEKEPNNNTSFTIPPVLKDYYKSVDFTKAGQALFNELATLTIEKHSTFLEYSSRHKYLPTADRSANDANKVVLIYTGEVRSSRSNNVNTEHVYPQSKIGNTAKGDLHHLRYCDSNVNSKRANYPFISGSGGARLVNGNSWYPGDEWKGDVARMVLYLNLRYNEDLGEDISREGINLFLKWNAEDPVSAIEINRNEVIQQAQGNRNPFIDNPYLATLIWGKDKAQNRW